MNIHLSSIALNSVFVDQTASFQQLWFNSTWRLTFGFVQGCNYNHLKRTDIRDFYPQTNSINIMTNFIIVFSAM